MGPIYLDLKSILANIELHISALPVITPPLTII